MGQLSTYMYLDFITNNGSGIFIMEGYLGGDEVSLKDAELVVDGVSHKLTPVERTINHEGSELHKPIANTSFICEIDLSEHSYLSVEASCRGLSIPIRTNRFTGLSGLRMSYVIKGDWVIVKKNNLLKFYPYSNKLIKRLEFRYCWQIMHDWRLSYVAQKVSYAHSYSEKLVTAIKMLALMAETAALVPRALRLRRLYWRNKAKKIKPIWIISDRPTAARDNGEALFRHISTSDNKDIDVYFAIADNTKDYANISAIGKTLAYGKFEYLLKFLLSDKIISSHADIETINPFLRQLDHYVDLLKFDFVFIQHGIIRTDLSEWLNRYNRNIKLFITSSISERDSILNLPYHYDESQVALTGLPRFDYLKNEPKGKIMLAPTYRKYLLNHNSNKYGVRKYDTKFKNSEYFDFYNRFIQDSRINQALKEHDLRAEFYLHPVISAQAIDFTPGERFQVMSTPYDYTTALNESEMLISDYSSIVFDFAYLKKPILYTQFDRDRFYSSHAKPNDSIFNDEREGFGVVCYDYDTAVEQAIEIIKNGFIVSDEYIDRSDRYFYKRDAQNSSRVYDAIKGMERKELS